MTGPPNQLAAFSVPLAKPCYLSSTATSSTAGYLENPRCGPSPHVHNTVGTQCRDSGSCPKDSSPRAGQQEFKGRLSAELQLLACRAGLPDAEHFHQ